MTDVVVGPALTRIGQIAIRALDLARATAFYRDTLGLRFLFDAGPLVFFDCGGVRLMLSRPEPEHDHPSSILYFQVDDLTAQHRVLSGRGVAFEREPHLIARMPDHDLWMAFFRDSEGNLLALYEERRG